MAQRSGDRRYEAALVGVALIWGINFPVVKSAITLVGPLTFNALRFTISGGLLAFLYWREVRDRADGADRASVGHSWMYVLGLGLLGHFAYQLLFILGIDRTTSGNSAFLISSAPLWTAVAAGITRQERLTRRQAIGTIVAFIGAATLVVARGGVSLVEGRTIGNLLSLGGAAAWGSYTALAKPALRNHSPTGLAFWTMLPAIPLLWISSFFEPSRGDWIGIPEIWLAVAYSGLFSIGVAYVIWNVGIRHVGPSRTAVYANMVPIVALVIGVFWLGESISVAEIAGAMLIMSGLYLVRR